MQSRHWNPQIFDPPDAAKCFLHTPGHVALGMCFGNIHDRLPPQVRALVDAVLSPKKAEIMLSTDAELESHVVGLMQELESVLSADGTVAPDAQSFCCLHKHKYVFVEVVVHRGGEG